MSWARFFILVSFFFSGRSFSSVGRVVRFSLRVSICLSICVFISGSGRTNAYSAVRFLVRRRI